MGGYIELIEPAGFINVKKVSLGELVGKKVILLDFWAYSCINCIRTLPHVRGWYDKYKGEGLEIVGVHTPEFDFEKKRKNVLAAVRKFGIKYPVVLDSEHKTWNAYGDSYWPLKFLIDINGNIAYKHIGEGAYAETERKVRELLQERAKVLGTKEGIPKETQAPAAPSFQDMFRTNSPEVYFGALRNSYLANGRPNAIGTQRLQEPREISTNALYLAGEWDVQPEYAENRSAGAKIIFRYAAKSVYLVASSEKAARIRVLRDGVPLKAGMGEDVSKSTLTVREPRMYRIVEDADYGEHTLEFVVEKPGLRVFTFTFG